MAAHGLAARAAVEARKRVGLMLTDMDLVDPERPRLATSFEGEVDWVVAHADETYWHGILTGLAPDVLGPGAASVEHHPAVALAEAMLVDPALRGPA